MRRVPTRVLVVTGLLVALLLAGVVSFYASGSPDGLERVAEDEGFLDRAEEHAAADGPLADYQAKGVDDDRLAGGLAGVTGALVVLVVAGGLTYALRRRQPEHELSDRG
jgi:cobalt/nickel transport protein